MCVYHIIFIHSSVGGHLGCFHILAMVNNAMNIEVRVSFQIMVFSGYMPKSGIAGSYDGCFYFLRNSPILSPKWLYEFTFPQQCTGFPFLHIFMNICCVLFDDSNSDWREVIPHCSFDLHFSNN